MFMELAKGPDDPKHDGPTESATPLPAPEIQPAGTKEVKTASTLLQALQRAVRASKNVSQPLEDYIAPLWLLLRYLRAAPDGCDSQFLPKPQVRDGQQKELNWHLKLEQQLAALNRWKEQPCGRTSRAAAWQMLAQKFVNAAQLPDLSHLSVGPASVVYFKGPNGWQLGLVTFMWRSWTRGSKTKKKPTLSPLPLDQLDYLRILALQPVNFGKHGEFEADSTAVALVARPWQVACTVVAKQTASSAGFHCFVAEDTINTKGNFFHLHFFASDMHFFERPSLRHLERKGCIIAFGPTAPTLFNQSACGFVVAFDCAFGFLATLLP